MTQRETNLEAVRLAFDGLGAGDLQAVRAVVSEDIVWHVPGDSKISGDAVGIEAWAAKLQSLFASGLNAELLNVMAEGDQVITVQRNSASASDGELDILVLNLFTLADGKLSRMQTFPGDQYALDAFWGR